MDSTYGLAKYLDELPNGSSFQQPLGHPGSDSSKTTDFAQAFAAAGHTWSSKLCEAKFPGSSMTNGAAFGDPCCTWKKGGKPDFTVTAFTTTPGKATTCASKGGASGTSSGSGTPAASGTGGSAATTESSTSGAADATKGGTTDTTGSSPSAGGDTTANSAPLDGDAEMLARQDLLKEGADFKKKSAFLGVLSRTENVYLQLNPAATRRQDQAARKNYHFIGLAKFVLLV
ncbi:hypothetical protein PHMEG_0008030 [Phytophthora megakarya]|uniref:Temptin Cys/Cys disulfide domain-containing protein n=1 Tax=Phytophthora megakarya TaxID=4795 RepID=A0A225WLE5_9STRA|nr:hypothetical protein PHMEG_0008030 [Phytophthora megakarya]